MAVYGLIGFPLTHSFSKAYFTAKFEREGLSDCSYINCEIESLDLLKSTIENEKLVGFNVTIPFKSKIISYLDSINEAAEKIGAANTVIRAKNNQLKGYNTDYIGFKESIKPFLKPYHTQALILGNGGSAKAVAYVLNELNIEYRIATRNPVLSEHIHYDQLTALDVRNAALIINTTPLGMFPNIDGFPDIPYQGIDKFHLLFDLVYNPSESQFLKKGSAKGAQTINGYSMLVRQAEEAWKIWQGN